MPTPPFVLAARERLGHDLMWLPGVSAVVVDGGRDPRVLLVHRSDDGQWTPVSGILEPGEQPAAGMVREIAEETGLAAELVRITSVVALPEHTYPNGDRAQFVDICFLARLAPGADPDAARPADDESTEVGWFAPDALPPMAERHRERIRWALRSLATGDTAAHFAPPAGR